MTNDLVRRVWEHKQGITKGFTNKYQIKKFVYYESTDDITAAIEREKQIKKWRREKKIELVKSMNASWSDLYFDL